jgi:tRNA dimethylallyltransferase
LIDVVDLSASFDAAQFVRLAQDAVSAIRGRERMPILCGGTGLYFKAFFAGLGEAPPASPEVRAELEKVPLEMLLRELARKDPQTYEQIDRQNSRRVVRALEVIRTTGKPFSAQRARWSETFTAGASPWIVGLEREDLDLKKRIDARIDQMFRNRLVEETQGLLRTGLASNRTALQALGYRQVVEHLQGTRSLLETIELVKVRTRQFAKRQRTWFKGQLPIQWKHVSSGESAEAIAQCIVETGRLDLKQPGV